MERHDAVLGEAEDAADIEGDDDAVVHAGRQDAGADIGGEIERAGEHVDQHHGREEL